MAYNLPLHVETHGAHPDEAAEVFVLLHGFGGSSFSWRYWLPVLAERGHVVLVDMKGFGSAPKPDDGHYSPKDQAELVLRLIRQRDLRRMTLIGHSLGGGVALLTALGLLDERSDRLRRIIIVAGAAARQKLPPFVSLARRPLLSRTLVRLLGWKRIIRRVLGTIVYDARAVTTSQVEGYAHPLRGRESLRALLDSAVQIVPDDLDSILARYPEITVPALLLWGRHDRVVPLTVGRRLHQELPRSRLVVLEECGHLPAEERVEESIGALVAFLDETPALTGDGAVPEPG